MGTALMCFLCMHDDCSQPLAAGEQAAAVGTVIAGFADKAWGCGEPTWWKSPLSLWVPETSDTDYSFLEQEVEEGERGSGLCNTHNQHIATAVIYSHHMHICLKKTPTLSLNLSLSLSLSLTHSLFVSSFCLLFLSQTSIFLFTISV